jgi:hypothetical protein
MIKFTRGMAVGLVATAMVAALASPASANSFYTGGTANSIWNFQTGSTSYVQSHGGDDIAFDVTSGISVDMRWSKCSDSSVTGSIHYDINPGNAYRVLGTDFLATTCLHIQYRGYTQTGSFNGYTYWNYNFA